LFVHEATGAASLRRPFRDVAAAYASRRNHYNDWQCYNPMNHQTRQLAASCIGSPHHIHLGGTFMPPYPAAELESALQMVAKLDMVGIVELYSLSMCLFLDTLGVETMPEHCFNESAPFRLVKPVTYGVPQHKLAEVDDATLSLIDSITELDVALYAAGQALLLSMFDEFQRTLPRGRPLGRHLLREAPV
jgi:hypothetical protein